MQTASSMLFLTILIATLPHIQGQVRFNDAAPACQTYPSKAWGSCVPIAECPSLNNLLAAARQGQTSALEILRGSVCSRSDSNGQLNVCCPPRGGLPDRCGGNNGTERLVGGENALLLQWPWMALLRAKGGDIQGWICGGVLISAQYVLTAAHCVIDVDFSIEFVRLGELVLNSNPDSGGSVTAPNPQDITIEKIIGHPQYKSGCRRCNDIALLRLSSPAKIDELFVKPICISKDPASKGILPSRFNKLEAWVAGWGSTVDNPFVFSQPAHLQHLQLPIQDLDFCKQRKREYSDPNMILCAGGKEGADTCRGDSGGPLMIASDDHVWYTIGIVSFGNAICGAPDTQTVFTNINHYVSWIEENVLA